MKKIFTGLLLVVILLFLSTYFFIPRTLTVSKVAYLHCNIDAAFRTVSHLDNLRKLDETKDEVSDTNTFAFNSAAFTVSRRLQNMLEIAIRNNGVITNSSFLMVPLNQDTTGIQWTAVLQTGYNPFKKLQQYQKALSIKRSMTAVLEKLTPFLENQENVYGVKINRESTKDTFLIATKTTLPAYPTTNEIYRSISLLEKNVAKQGAKQTGKPIMNVTELGTGQCQFMIALPINKQALKEGNVFATRMIPGNFLTTEVTGGNSAVINGLHSMQQYIIDYKKTNMAIPFATLITDRSKEPDTSKWVTKLYYPVAF